MGNPRRERVAKAMRDNLATMIAQKVKDPRVTRAGMVMVNHVELNSDMGVATVYISFIVQDEKIVAAAMAGLQSAARFLRGPVAQLNNLARSPELRFQYDNSLEFGLKLEQIVTDDEERKVSLETDALNGKVNDEPQ